MNLPEPDIEFIDARNVVLKSPWSIVTGIGRLDVDAGATSDGASTPEIIWAIPGFVPFEGDTLPAAFAHDQLYAGELCDRLTADNILRDLLIANGVSWLRATAYFYAVRAFGGIVWARHTDASQAAARQFARIEPLK